MSSLNFKISFPTDNGFWGRECKGCGKYFRVDSDKIKPELYCPYCGELQSNDQLWTEAQKREVKQIATEVGKRYIEDELEKVFKRAFENSKYIKYQPGRKTIPKTTVTHHVEKKVDTEIECPICNLRFQVFGIFGYCPSCKEENLKIYETNFQIILQEIDTAGNPGRALRHAYNDVISTFEAYCKLVAKKNGLRNANFQNLKGTKELFKEHGVDIYLNVSEGEKIVIKRIFEKRHAYQHAQGIITEQFIQNIPYDRHLLNQQAQLSVEEISSGIEVLKKITCNIMDKYCM